MLRHRAMLAMRRFFEERGFAEADTPLLIKANSLEPHIDPFCVPVTGFHAHEKFDRYLHTSPELSLKRLLSYGVDRLYQLSHVFRDGEISERHLPEFTMLEWYRNHGCLQDLITDCELMFRAIAEAMGEDFHSLVDFSTPFTVTTVENLWNQVAKIDLRLALERMEQGEEQALVDLVTAKGYALREGADFEDAFHHVMVTAIEPVIGQDKPCVVLNWPRQMAVLAKVCEADPLFAERFEIYAGGLELANAFQELTDPVEQRKRFEEDNQARRKMGKPVLPLNEGFLEDLAHMPACAGIALGFDRLLMVLLGKTQIADVQPLNWLEA